MWLHGDLHPANILVDRGRISAVIDFGDITSGDPATDLSVAWMLFTAEQRVALRGPRVPPVDGRGHRDAGSPGLAGPRSAGGGTRRSFASRGTVVKRPVWYVPVTAPECERHGEPGCAWQRGQGWRSTSSAWGDQEEAAAPTCSSTTPEPGRWFTNASAHNRAAPSIHRN
ncbi:phosphotransferase [Streptomyces lydicus]|uniref:phosphotransferase n=1 Tax=Streptomyces lydicus TaxID=47763 RepID=UPI0037A668A8